MRKALFASALAATMAVSATAAAVTGNGAPSGGHYTLNIVGVAKDKTADMTDTSRHVIFVPLDGKAKINLADSGALDGVDDFAVLDGNGTDGEAAFALPDPDVDGDGTLDGDYVVYARPLGTPGGAATVTTCATYVGDEPIVVKGTTLDPEATCSLESVELVRKAGRSTFTNVTNELLTIVIGVDTDGDGDIDETIRLPLFDDDLEGEFWEYDNRGLRVAQIRFYPTA